MLLFRISLILIIMGIAYLSIIPTQAISVGSDKLGHFIAYAVLMTNVGFLSFDQKSHFIRGIVLSLLYGALIEVIQHYVPGRVMSAYDMLANATGVLLGVIITFILYKPLMKVFKKMKLV